MDTRVERTRSFPAQDDTGRIWILDVFTEYRALSTGAEIRVGERARTKDGERVNPNGKGEYEVRRPFGNVRLHSDHPDAL